MMTHVTRHFQEWIDGRLDNDARRAVESHLDECADCRAYFDRLSFLLEKPRASELPRLDPDPFVPARIRAAGKGRGERITLGELIRPFGWVRLSLVGGMLAIAVVLGVSMGRGLSGDVARADGDIYSEYYKAFSQSSLSDSWESLVETDNGS
jgi:anti-sigma factor RsiW